MNTKAVKNATHNGMVYFLLYLSLFVIAKTLDLLFLSCFGLLWWFSINFVVAILQDTVNYYLIGETMSYNQVVKEGFFFVLGHLFQFFCDDFYLIVM